MDRNISAGQLMHVLTLALLCLGTEAIFPVLSAGAAAWLAPLLTGVPVLAALALLWHPKKDQYKTGRQSWWSTLPGRVFQGVFLLWGVLLLAVHALRIGNRMAESFQTTPLLLAAGILALSAWMASGTLPAFARACTLFALAVGAVLVLTTLFTVFRLRWDFVFLIKKAELAQVPGAALALGESLAVGLYGLFLTEDVAASPNNKAVCLRRTGGIFLWLSAILILILGRFGPALTDALRRPFFQMVSGIGFEGAFQRLEGLISALWLLGDAALLGLLLHACRKLLAGVMGGKNRKGYSWLLAGVAFLAAPWTGALQESVVPVGSLIAAAGILLLFAWSPAAKKNQKKVK